MSTATQDPPRVGTLLQRIRLVRARIRLVGLLKVVTASAAMLLAAGALSFLVDREFEPGLPVRLPLVLFAWAVTIVGILATARRWLAEDLSDDRVALLIEAANPWLEDRFISAVQLARELGDAGELHSAEMIGATIGRAVEERRGFKAAASARMLPVLPGLLAVAGVAALGGAAFSTESTSDYATVWRDRVLWLDGQARYPKPVTIEVQIPEENQGATPLKVQVVRGEDLTVSVKILRGGTDRMDITTRFKVSGNDETRAMGLITEGTYAKTYQNVTEPFRFQVNAGYGVVSEIYEVALVDRARIEEARFWLSYPDYTRLEPTPADKPLTRTFLEVPVGTVLRYEVLATLGVDEAQLQVFKDEENKQLELGPAPQVGGQGALEGRLLTGEIQVMASQRFRFALVADGVVGDKNSVLYSVKAIEDKPPSVTFKEPGRSKSVTKVAQVPMELSVRDQYGIDRVELRLAIKRGGEVLRRTERALETTEGDEQKATYAWVQSIADMEMREGDILEYYAVAYDRNIDETKRAGRSLAYTLTIVSEDDLSRLLQDRLLRLKDDLTGAVQAQENALEDAVRLRDELALKESLSRDDQRRLARVENQQRNVSTRMAKVAEEFARLQEERKVNRLMDEREEILQRTLEESARELAEQQSPAVERDLRDLQSQPESLDNAKLSRVPDKQQRIQKGIQALVDKLDKWGDISDADRELKEIIESQEKIHENTGLKLKEQNR